MNINTSLIIFYKYFMKSISLALLALVSVKSESVKAHFKKMAKIVNNDETLLWTASAEPSEFFT